MSLQEVSSMSSNNKKNSSSSQMNINIQKFEQGSIFSLVVTCFKDGIPSSFTIGDYNLLTLLTKALLSQDDDVELSAASSYFTAYYSLFFVTAVLAIQETQGIYGSRAFGKRKYRQLNLIMRQSLFAGFLLYTTFGILPYFGLRPILAKFGNSESLIQKSCKMILCCYPGMGIRLINDCIKPFLQSQGQELLKEYGWFYFRYFALISFPLNYVVIKF
jgi:Na+-driven multidrug efflux pump